MSIYQKLKDDLLQARIQRIALKSVLLSTLVGELYQIAKDAGQAEPTDEQCVKRIKKFMEDAQDTMSKTQEPERKEALSQEIAILKPYLPVVDLYSEDYMVYVIDQALEHKEIQSGKSFLGDTMKFFKQHHAGKYEPKDLKKAVEEYQRRTESDPLAAKQPVVSFKTRYDAPQVETLASDIVEFSAATKV